ncbi:MAG: sigma-70 family RNA polymerase sigma factor [Acidobacteriota bacterium]|nr:sigma-70 family RNA polymerase sigma factor [Acidobacteriota bacterium]
MVQRQSRFVFRVAYSVLRNAHDSEDIVQETFLRIYRARRWDRMQNEKAFLARTAWRLAVDRVRCQRGSLVVDGPSTGQNPEQAVISAQWDASVHRLIDSLPEDLRRPLALSSLEELNSREIADVMGIPEGTVRTRLMRARNMVKQKLARLMEAHYGKA